MKNIRKISASDIPKIVLRHIEANEPVIFFGPPGIGKSAQVYWAVKKLAEKMERTYVEQPRIDDWMDNSKLCISTTLSSQLDELDTKGAIWIDNSKKNPIANFTATNEFPAIEINPNLFGIKFLDEFGNGQMHILNALQPIILERIAGNKKVAPGLRFILASNRIEDNTGVNVIPMALRNRMASYEVEVMPMDDWFKIMKKIGKPIRPEIEAFLRAFERYYYTFNPNDTDSFAYASPRTYDKANRMMEGVTDIQEMGEILSGWVGEDIGRQFVSFMKISVKIDMDEIIRKPKTIKKYESDVGQLYSILVGMIERVRKNKKLLPKILDIANELSREEFGVYLLSSLITEVGINKVSEALKGRDNLVNKYLTLLE